VGEAIVTFEVDETLRDEFVRATAADDRSDAQVLRDLMREYVQRQRGATEDDAWFRDQVRDGLASARAGRLIPGAEVEAHFAAKREATRRRLGGAE